MNWMLLALAGMGGVLSRAAVVQLSPVSWPMGAATLIVNVIGCFLMGVLLTHPSRWASDYRSVLAVGFLGGLTTFSGFVVDVYKYSQTQQWSHLGVYFVLTHVLGILLFFCGLWLGAKS